MQYINEFCVKKYRSKIIIKKGQTVILFVFENIHKIYTRYILTKAKERDIMWYNDSVENILTSLDTNEKTGISDIEAQNRREYNGKNELQEKEKDSFIKRFLEQFKDYMVIILLIAAAISFVASLISGDADYFDSIIILSIVMLNAAIGVFQESRAQKALDALKKMSAPTVCVMRDSKKKNISASELVAGDIIFLKMGDMVPADARLISANNLKCNESALTGESTDVEKDAKFISRGELNISDAKNMVFSSCIVTYGHACAVVVETGMNTQVGKIARMIIDADTLQTPLQEKLARTGKTLGIISLIICGVIFLMGIIRRLPIFDMFMTSISLAVAAIPEGLPTIVTIMLALGVQKMAKRNAIVRRLPAVETLGSASVICSDKTGTLTQNKMSVTKIYGNRSFALDLASLCNNGADPTERAIIEAAKNDGAEPELLSKKYMRIREIPFDSKKKYMVTTHKTDTGYRIIVKGAPEAVLSMCNITPYQKERIENENINMARDALRVLAVAYKDVSTPDDESITSLEFVALIGIIDPPRPEVCDAVKLCRAAGIKAVMITGDHIETAKAIAAQVGIYTAKDKAMTGSELNEITDDELTMIIADYSVFARVTPEHKVRIVNAWQRRGEVVAMTGDGVNDAPALKSADIGCAMGKNGTEVCKEAADMILCDDNFSTIVSAVEEGRVIFANIKKAVHFLLSSNTGELITIFFAIFIGWSTPLAPIHLLWINFITDSLPAIALGFESASRDIMTHKPINRRKSIFADGVGTAIVFEGVMIGVLALIAFSFGNNIWGSHSVAQTMAFCVLCFSQLVHAFNIRSEQSIFKVGIFSNKTMNFAFVICALLQVLVIALPPLAQLFKTTPLDTVQWFVVISMSLVPLLLVELEKYFQKKSEKLNKERRRVLLER